MLENKLLIEHLRVAEILITDANVKGSFSYMDFGLKLRQNIYSQAILILRNMGFKEIHLSDIIDRDQVSKLDQIHPISKNYYRIKDSSSVMAAGHEVSFYLFIKSLIKYNQVYKFPLGFFHFGSVFRYPKNTKFPFNVGEKRSFLECYFVYLNEQDKEMYFNLAAQWNRKFLQEILHLPLVETIRPLITNKRFSRKTQCIDTITPFGRTVNTGMTYLHDDIFSKVLEVKIKTEQQKKQYVRCIHFGVSDNAYFSYLLNSHDGLGFRLLTHIAPYCIQVIIEKNCSEEDPEVNILMNFLKKHNLIFQVHMEVNGSNKKVKKNCIIKGIPILIHISKKAGTLNLTLEYRGDSIKKPVSIKDLNIIQQLLRKNDHDIVEMFKKDQENSIIDCDSIIRVNETLALGKIARVYFEQEDEKILSLESQLDSGEILGFNEATIEGRDVVSQKMTNQCAYISKRI